MCAAHELDDNIESIAQDSEAGSSIPAFLNKINFRLWLNFGEGQKGNRKIGIVKGGVVTTGGMSPPIHPYASSGIGHRNVLADNDTEPAVTGLAKLSPVHPVESERKTRAQRGIGVSGFEPPASSSRTKRSNQAELHPEVQVSQCSRDSCARQRPFANPHEMLSRSRFAWWYWREALVFPAIAWRANQSWGRPHFV